MQPPNILFVTRSLHGTGGMQRYTRTLLDALEPRRDIAVTVCAAGAQRIFLPLFMIRAFVRALFFRGSTVHLGDAVLSPLAIPLSILRPHLRLTLTTYGLDVIYPNAAYQFVLRRSLRHFHRIVAISRATADELIGRGVDPAKVVVIPCATAGVNEPRLQGKKSSKQLLLLGREIKRKGTAWFLRSVFPILLREDPTIRCIIAGDGPECRNIESIIDELRLRASVSHLGFIDEATKEKLYAESHLFVMPNIAVAGDMEGFGLVCIEAAAHGCPVASSAREGMLDAVVNGITGCFFRSGDASDAAMVIRSALAKTWDTDLMKRTVAERYSPNLLASRYISNVFAHS